MSKTDSTPQESTDRGRNTESISANYGAEAVTVEVYQHKRAMAWLEVFRGGDRYTFEVDALGEVSPIGKCIDGDDRSLSAIPPWVQAVFREININTTQLE